MMAALTKDRLLAVAKVHSVFVHRFHRSDRERRALVRRLCEDGLLVEVEKSREGFRYRAASAEDSLEGNAS